MKSIRRMSKFKKNIQIFGIINVKKFFIQFKLTLLTFILISYLAI